MNCDERIEKTLNRAGQTISDLPKPNGIGMPYGIDKYEPLLKAAADFIQFNAPAGFEVFNVIQYALHLTDIIDRMETALVNVCGERDYLRSVVCGLCTNFREDGADACETCIVGDGVPEYWRADDE